VVYVTRFDHYVNLEFCRGARPRRAASTLVSMCAGWLLRQAHASHQVLETRIRPNRVETEVRVDPGIHGSFSIGFLERLKGVVPVPQAHINDGYGFGRDVPSRGEILPLVERFLRISSIARNTQCVSQIQ
jgi:hypothetical protein